MKRFIVLGWLLLSFVACKESDKDVGSAEGSMKTQEEVDKVRETKNPKIDKLTKAIFNDQKNANLYYERAKLYSERGAYPYAISDVTLALKLDSLQPNFYVLLADSYLRNGESAKSIAVFKKSIERFPEDLNIQLNYGELLITLNQLEEAVRVIDGVLYKDNTNSDAFFLMGFIMMITQDTTKAVAALKKAVELDPEIVDGHLMLAKLHETTDRKLALQYYDNAIYVSKGVPEAYHQKAFYLQNIQRESEAIELYDKIKQTNPQYGPAFLNTGILYLEMDSLDKAYENFNILTKVRPADAKAYYYRGYVLEAMGKVDLALKDYRQSLVFDTTYVKAKEAIKSLNTN